MHREKKGRGPLLRKIMVCAAIALAALEISIKPVDAADVRIAVLISGPGAPYDETLAGLRQHLEKTGTRAEYAVFQLGGDAAKATQAVSGLQANKPGLIVALGTFAADKAVKEISDVPIVAAMILRPDVLKKAANATGVVLEFPTETQLQWIRKVLPKAQSVGVVFNPAENREQVERAGRAAQKLGLKLEAREVPAPKDLPAALDQLANNTDVLWGIADTTALNPQTAKLIFLFSFRNRVPFVGPSPAWVKAGALYSLDWDYADMGAQCGELAQKVLQGAQAGSLPPVPPRKVLYSVNRKTAEDMAVKVPDEILRGAATLY